VYSTLRKLILICVGTALTGLALTAVGRGVHAPKSSGDTSSDDLGQPTGPDALRQIVQNQCIVHWIQKHDPAPCDRVFLPDMDPEGTGYAVLADQKGAAHYLLIPTQSMSGVDSTELLDPDLPNYFAEAWNARDLITKFVGHPVPRSDIALAVNTAHARTQHQFHIHMECLRKEVVDSLRAGAEETTDTWAPLPVAGSTYQAMRIMGIGLDGANPFELLNRLSPDVRHHMGDYTLVVAGMQFKSGAGFIVLTGTGPTGELLLDASCAVAGAGA
jgi:CDP-diacylglycerol pyrophosphatase